MTHPFFSFLRLHPSVIALEITALSILHCPNSTLFLYILFQFIAFPSDHTRHSTHANMPPYTQVLSALRKNDLICLCDEFRLPTEGSVVNLRNRLKDYLNLHRNTLFRNPRYNPLFPRHRRPVQPIQQPEQASPPSTPLLPRIHHTAHLLVLQLVHTTLGMVLIDIPIIKTTMILTITPFYNHRNSLAESNTFFSSKCSSRPMIPISSQLTHMPITPLLLQMLQLAHSEVPFLQQLYPQTVVSIFLLSRP